MYEYFLPENAVPLRNFPRDLCSMKSVIVISRKATTLSSTHETFRIIMLCNLFEKKTRYRESYYRVILCFIVQSYITYYYHI